MQVYVQDYGVIDFRPEEVYRFDGKAEHTQLRGSIRTNPNNDWVSHNYWYDLRDVLVAHSNDLNLVIGLPVLTRADLDKELQRQEKIEKELSNILEDIKEREQEFLCNKCGKPLSECDEGTCVDERNKLVEKIVGLKEGKLLVCGVHTKPGGVSWSEFYQFLKDVKVVDLNNKMTTLTLDFAITEECNLVIYKGDDHNLYMFNDFGDLLVSSELKDGVVWNFAVGSFKINDDRIVTQTKEYHDKYYTCKDCEDTILEESWVEQGDGYYSNSENLKEAYDTYVNTDGDIWAADDTDIEEEIQRVLKAMRELDLEDEAELSHYRKLVSALGQLKEIQKYI